MLIASFSGPAFRTRPRNVHGLGAFGNFGLATLSQGATGADVTTLQQQLVTLGYLAPADVVGTFGPKTNAAVRKFQTDSGLSPVDGIVGSDTWNALTNALSAQVAPTTATATGGIPSAACGAGTQLDPSTGAARNATTGICECPGGTAWDASMMQCIAVAQAPSEPGIFEKLATGFKSLFSTTPSPPSPTAPQATPGALVPSPAVPGRITPTAAALTPIQIQKPPLFKRPLFWVAVAGGAAVLGGGSYLLLRKPPAVTVSARRRSGRRRSAR